jgi:hypothetical protein
MLATKNMIFNDILSGGTNNANNSNINYNDLKREVLLPYKNQIDNCISSIVSSVNGDPTSIGLVGTLQKVKNELNDETKNITQRFSNSLFLLNGSPNIAIDGNSQNQLIPLAIEFLDAAQASTDAVLLQNAIDFSEKLKANQSVVI